MINTILHLQPKHYGYLYLVSIPLFGFLYWLNPGVLSAQFFTDCLYFSVVTITTLGYGEITPLTGLGKFIAGVQAVFGICLIGLFLNALAEKRDTFLAKSKAEDARLILESHIALVIEAIESGNPFIWDKHAINAKKFSELTEYSLKLKHGVLDETYKLHQLQIRALLETSRQNYSTFLALVPVATSISSITGGQWISLISNINNLKSLCDRTVENQDDDEILDWPSQNEVALQIEEFVSTSLTICSSNQ